MPRQIGPQPGGKHRLDRVTRSTAQTNHRDPRGLAPPLPGARALPMADPTLATARTRAPRGFGRGPPGIIGLRPSRRSWYADHARATPAAGPPRPCAACACFHPFAVLGIGISPASAAFLLRPGPVFVKSRFEGASFGPEGELCLKPLTRQGSRENPFQSPSNKVGANNTVSALTGSPCWVATRATSAARAAHPHWVIVAHTASVRC
jgi:hypothetical protein